ncbi:hypothetical protein ES708_33362 [subsurface metagenome]
MIGLESSRRNLYFLLAHGGTLDTLFGELRGRHIHALPGYRNFSFVAIGIPCPHAQHLAALGIDQGFPDPEIFGIFPGYPPPLVAVVEFFQISPLHDDGIIPSHGPLKLRIFSGLVFHLPGPQPPGGKGVVEGHLGLHNHGLVPLGAFGRRLGLSLLRFRGNLLLYLLLDALGDPFAHAAADAAHHRVPQH